MSQAAPCSPRCTELPLSRAYSYETPGKLATFRRFFAVVHFCRSCQRPSPLRYRRDGTARSAPQRPPSELRRSIRSFASARTPITSSGGWCLAFKRTACTISRTCRSFGCTTIRPPPDDLGPSFCQRHGIELVKTPAAALGGAGGLDVDAVALIIEHGDYPVNEFGQILYPRYELFQQIVEFFKKTGRSVPVFCDKHLSYDHQKGGRHGRHGEEDGLWPDGRLFAAGDVASAADRAAARIADRRSGRLLSATTAATPKFICSMRWNACSACSSGAGAAKAA